MTDAPDENQNEGFTSRFDRCFLIVPATKSYPGKDNDIFLGRWKSPRGLSLSRSGTLLALTPILDFMK